jgi:hypothetical protein
MFTYYGVWYIQQRFLLYIDVYIEIKDASTAHILVSREYQNLFSNILPIGYTHVLVYTSC